MKTRVSSSLFKKKYYIDCYPCDILKSKLKLDRLIKSIKADKDHKMINEYIEFNNIKGYHNG